MNADVAAINRGEGSRVGNSFTINGRTYLIAGETGDHLVPEVGAGFHTLNRGEFDALGIFNKFGDTEKGWEYAGKVADSASVQRAFSVWQLR
jgi:hypothetical protein